MRCNKCDNCRKLERSKASCLKALNQPGNGEDVMVVWNDMVASLPCEREATDLIAGGPDNPNPFPHYKGEPLSWCLNLTQTDEEEGFPRLRAVTLAMKKYRPDYLRRERFELLRSSMSDRMFGHNAKKLLNAIDSILAEGGTK